MLYHDMKREQKIIRRELARRERILTKPNGYKKLMLEDAKLNRKYAREAVIYAFLHRIGESSARVMLVVIFTYTIAGISLIMFLVHGLPFLSGVWDGVAARARDFWDWFQSLFS